jgi:8-oxo-dGTP diphosphatase
MPNVFETGARKNIPAVLIYAQAGGSGMSSRTLMIHRDAPDRKASDYHSGKWNGLGGKCEADESAFEAAAREFKEEAGIDVPIERFQSLGILQFPNFKAHRSEDWTVFVFTLDLNEEEAKGVHSKSDEGSLHWIPSADLSKLNLWPGDRHFIPYIVDRKPFQGTIWYRDSEVIRHDVRKLV